MPRKRFHLNNAEHEENLDDEEWLRQALKKIKEERRALELERLCLTELTKKLAESDLQAKKRNEEQRQAPASVEPSTSTSMPTPSTSKQMSDAAKKEVEQNYQTDQD